MAAEKKNTGKHEATEKSEPWSIPNCGLAKILRKHAIVSAGCFSLTEPQEQKMQKVKEQLVQWGGRSFNWLFCTPPRTHFELAAPVFRLAFECISAVHIGFVAAACCGSPGLRLVGFWP